PHMLVLMNFNEDAIYMLGSDEPIGWDSATVSRFLDTPGAEADITGAPNSDSMPDMSWTDLLNTMRWLEDGEVDRFVGEGPLITDDHPLTEYYLLHNWGHQGEEPLTGPFLRTLARR